MTFERTVCACNDCRAYCRIQPGGMLLSDVAPILAATGKPATEILRASPGSLIGVHEDDGGVSLRLVGSIAPATDADGRCVFFENERCTIHAVAPFGCSRFDSHMDGEEADLRARHGIRDMMTDEYQRFRATLPPATTWRPR